MGDIDCVCQKLIDDLDLVLRVQREDVKFFLIALNLSGRSEELMDRAMGMIDRNGLRKALMISNNL